MRILFALLAAFFVAAPLAVAEPACNAPLVGPGRALSLREPLTDEDRKALSAAVFLALSNDSGQADATLQAIEEADPCPISSFDVDGVTWSVSGANSPAPLRYASATGVDTYYYLVSGPSLSDAAAWALRRRGGRAASGAGAHTYLVAIEEGLHFVFRIYDGAPDARGLANDLAAIIGGKVSPIAVYDPEGDAVTVALQTESPVLGELFRPVLLEGSRNATLLGPDGILFSLDPAGLRLQGSDQICADALGPLERSRLTVLDPRPEVLDLGCGYQSDVGWLSLFSTRRPDASGDKAYFRSQIRSTQAETGVRKRTPMRGRAAPGALRAGEVWVDKEDYGQGVWFIRRGDFVIEVRATFRLEGTDAVFQAIEQIVGNAAASAAIADGPA